MKKAQLVEKIAVEADITHSEAKAALNALLCSITTALKAGDNVALVGFGTFKIENELHALAVTLKQDNLSTLRRPRSQCLNLAKHLKRLLIDVLAKVVL